MAAWTVHIYYILLASWSSTLSPAASFLAPTGPSLTPSSWRSRPAGPSSSFISNQRSHFTFAVSSTTRKQKEKDPPALQEKEKTDGGGGPSLLDKVYKQFLRSLWKGMALPFPQLRNVVLPRSLKAMRGRSKGDSSSFTVGLSFREGLLALVLYLASGVLAYSILLEKWSIVDALYVSLRLLVHIPMLLPTDSASLLTDYLKIRYWDWAPGTLRVFASVLSVTVRISNSKSV